MTVEVDHIDTAGTHSLKTFQMSQLAFIKHMAMSGQGYRLTPGKIFRTLGMFLHFHHYLRIGGFNQNRFTEPPAILSDPTEKNHFSNLAGKAIADFLSKRIDGGIFTINYEAAMRQRNMRINLKRPDLIAYTQRSSFAIEAKGRSQPNSGKMKKHKTQAGCGPIPVNFSVACVSYNLYSEVKCNYHDPYNDNIPYDEKALAELSKAYYAALSEFLNEKYFYLNEVTYSNEKFLTVRPNTLFRNVRPYFQEYLFQEIIYILNPVLILPLNVRELAEKGLSKSTTPFNYNTGEVTDNNSNVYIDADRVGFSMRPF